MAGALVLVAVLLVVLPVVLSVSGAVFAALLGALLRREGEATHEGSELVDLYV